jgi:hypothetical protein
MSDVEKALRDLVAKIEELLPAINSVTQIAAIHGAKWTAGNWVAEMKAAKAALAAQQNSPSGEITGQPFTKGAGAAEVASASPLGGLSEEEVRKIEQRAEKATPEPWGHAPQDGLPGHCHMAQVFEAEGRAVADIEPTDDPEQASRTADFIAHAREDIPKLIAALRARTIEAETLRRQASRGED